MAKRRANGEGVVRQRKDGIWEARILTGYDPKTGKLKRVSFYGKTQKEVMEKSAKARLALSEGTYTAP
jgi:integrase